MLTRIFLIGILWFAVFRFLGRILRFLAAPASPPRNRASRAASDRPGAGESGRRVEPSAPGDHTRGPGAPWDRGDVIDVEYEEVKPGSSGR